MIGMMDHIMRTRQLIIRKGREGRSEGPARWVVGQQVVQPAQLQPLDNDPDVRYDNFGFRCSLPGK